MESLGVGGKVGEGGRTGLAEMIRHTNVVRYNAVLGVKSRR